MRYCGRQFHAEELELIRKWIARQPPLNRYRLSLEICEQLNWRRPDGRLKHMSCRVAMLKMQADGLIELPAPERCRPVARAIDAHLEERLAEPLARPCIDLADIRLEPVMNRGQSRLWNAYIERYHYLGHQPLPGAQLRYLVHAGGQIVAALGFGASAWKTQPRDAFVGWTTAQRERNLPLIVNNARFLIFPWIRCKNLASRILALATRRLASDWFIRYAYRPVLLETFVEKPRFTGTCYKAANWQYLGDTQGRGKLDTLHLKSKPIKGIWVYPLVPDFRHKLCAP
jgi:hypothetical protein